MLARVLEAGLNLAPHLVQYGLGDMHPAGFGQSLDPDSDIDAVAVEIAGIDHHISKVDTDAQQHSPGRRLRLDASHSSLHLDRALHGVDSTRELDQRTVA